MSKNDFDTALSGDSVAFFEKMSEIAKKEFYREWHGFLEDFKDDREVYKSTGDNISVLCRDIVNFFRSRGHAAFSRSPLSKESRAEAIKQFKIEALNLIGGEQFLDKEVSVDSFVGRVDDLLSQLSDRYCGDIGYEFEYINDEKEKIFLRSAIENEEFSLSTDDRKLLLKLLVQSSDFEDFLHVKFQGYKRFSIEGVDALLPALYFLFRSAAESGINKVVLGMAHRGRLNTLVNLFDKPYEDLFREFHGGAHVDEENGFVGDVKYHIGASKTFKFANETKLDASLCFNPSHLESVNPLVAGMARAFNDTVKGANALGVTVHGDAAFSGQGVVYESLVLSGLSAYSSGGSIRIITNNNIGFTTDSSRSRFTPYCTDVVKFISVPVFHVNADAPEDVLRAVDLALRYRNEFKKDCVVDILGYRRYGHNEGDEPTFTQPLAYIDIEKHSRIDKIYGEFLSSIDDSFKGLKESLAKEFKETLMKHIKTATEQQKVVVESSKESDFHDVSINTLTKEKLIELMKSACKVDDGFNIHPKLSKILKTRVDALTNDEPLDWGSAEILSFASLIDEKYHLRFSGQDVRRGTFSHRHARLVDVKTGKDCMPLLDFAKNNEVSCSIEDSPLSEYAVLGFEYGYSLIPKKALVIWEGQFGDFANGAQIIIDQYICSAETKWGLLSNIVLLLPHGYEGMGPEHSSARPERFLQLCTGSNMLVANCTKPANYFHLLRKVTTASHKRPTIIFTPKSLLRHRMAVSYADDFLAEFLPVICHRGYENPNNISSIIICSGKVVYDIINYAREHNIDDGFALISLEQLNPFPAEELENVFNKFPNLNKFIWCQEEPKNMGAFFFFQDHFRSNFPNYDIRFTSRLECSSTACGSKELHDAQTDRLMQETFSYV